VKGLNYFIRNFINQIIISKKSFMKKIRIWIHVSSLFQNLYYLYKTHATWEILKVYVFNKLDKKKLLRKYQFEYSHFVKKISNLSLDSNWYSGNYVYWLSVFDEFQLSKKEKLKVLEIGSWEGLSSFFILDRLENATLTCVDTWAGSDEQNASSAETIEVFQKTEANFDKNLSVFGSRLIKIKSTSFSYYNEYTKREIYDLIYVDGSHHCDDVVIDAIKCFEQLKIGGLMILDDYLWRFYPNYLDNPASAINCFLKIKKNSYRILRVYEQIIIQKMSDRYSL
jgi:predicted O-methyltransferase YrrM